MIYDYGKLKERILKDFESLEAFSEEVGQTEADTMDILSSQKPLDLEDLIKWASVLNIPGYEVTAYFFTEKKEPISAIEDTAALLSNLPRLLEVIIDNYHLDEEGFTQEHADAIRYGGNLTICSIIRAVQHCINDADKALTEVAKELLKEKCPSTGQRRKGE